MIVDDSELNRMMMESFIDEMGHASVTASNGKEALELLGREHPDLILLDVMMPEMDGFEVCRRIKSDETTRMTPVIMVTALDKVDDNVKGIEAGADDFLTRPFDGTILTARTKALLQSKELNDEVLQLEQTKEDLRKMIVHDLRTPITSIKMSLELLRNQMDAIDEKQEELIQIAAADAEDALLLINNILDLSKMEAHKMEVRKEDTSISEMFRETVARVKPLTARQGLSLEIKEETEDVYCEIDKHLISRVLTNLLSNAFKFAEKKSSVILSVKQFEDGKVEIGVVNKGQTISKADQKKIFEKFGQGADDKVNLGTGLGLTFCKFAAEAHGGSIRVESPPPYYKTGAGFFVTLPLR